MSPESPRLLLLVAALLLAGLLWALWLALVRRRYRLTVGEPVRHTVQASDGWKLAIYERQPAKRQFEEPVLLCHGLSANHHTFDFEPPYSLAHHLCEAGFACFSIDWRGTGGSAIRFGRSRRYTIDDHIHFDASALLETALLKSGARKAFWLGHSLGGLIGYAFAQQLGKDKLSGLLALGAPVFFAYPPWMRRFLFMGTLAAWPFSLPHRLLGVSLSPFLGYGPLPFSELVMSPGSISPAVQRKAFSHLATSIGRGVLLQLMDWVKNDAFRSVDGKVNWREGLRGLKAPLLVMGGSADKLAPPDALKGQFELAGSEDKTLVVFGTDRGDKGDYGHGDLLFGTHAPSEVYPVVSQWLASRASSLGSHSGQGRP